MNQAVFLALLQPGDTFMGLDLSAGGHLTHGSPVNMSGTWQNFMALSMLLGGLFALASLPVANVPQQQREQQPADQQRLHQCQGAVVQRDDL